MKLRIIEECWGIDKITGERNTQQTDEKSENTVGNVIEMPTGKRKFHIDAVSEESITVTVVYDDNPAANVTFAIAKGENVLYQPMSRDGGYKYTLSCED